MGHIDFAEIWESHKTDMNVEFLLAVYKILRYGYSILICQSLCVFQINNFGVLRNGKNQNYIQKSVVPIFNM